MLLGAYRVIIHNKGTGEEIFFSDNAGNYCFYYDARNYGSNFLSFTENRDEKEPNYMAVVQLLMYNRIYGGQTIVDGVYYTETGKYYCKKNGKITSFSKELMDFDQLDRFSSLQEIVKTLTNFREDERVFAIATGGTDSRMVISHLHSLGVPLTLCISGKEGHIDEQIAKKISETLGLKLIHSNGTTGNREVGQIFRYCDGQAGLDGFFRLGEFSQLLCDEGADVVFGGASGEHYKNYYMNHETTYIQGKADLHKFYQKKILPHGFPIQMLGEKTIEAGERMEELFYSSLGDIPGKNKFQIYTQIGQKCLEAGIRSFGGLNIYRTLVNPLAERDAIATVYRRDPRELKHHQLHREEISKYAPELKKIKTNLGATCNNGKLSILRDDWVRIFRGVKRKVFKITNTDDVHEKTIDFEGSQKYLDAVKNLQDMDILNADSQKIPQAYADRIMTLGMYFGKKG
jgi:hypothetical protein